MDHLLYACENQAKVWTLGGCSRTLPIFRQIGDYIPSIPLSPLEICNKAQSPIIHLKYSTAWKVLKLFLQEVKQDIKFRMANLQPLRQTPFPSTNVQIPSLHQLSPVFHLSTSAALFVIVGNGAKETKCTNGKS